MAIKKQNIGHFTVGDLEYTEIGNDIFLILGRWGNHAMLIYNEKSKPVWSDTSLVASEIIKGGNGYYFLVLPSSKKKFLGINTKGTFFQYYHWLFGELKLEVPVETLDAIAEAESKAAQGQDYGSKPLLSNVCKYSWVIRYGGDPSNPKDYYCGRTNYRMVSPSGELGKKNHRNHLLLELTSNDLPPVIKVEQALNQWK